MFELVTPFYFEHIQRSMIEHVTLLALEHVTRSAFETSICYIVYMISYTLNIKKYISCIIY